MSRDSSDVYAKASPSVESNTTISSSVFNAVIDDIVNDLNLDRPIAAGGTGASTAAAARDNLGVAVKQASVNDGTAGAGLIVGAFGLGGNAPTSADWTAETLTKFLRTGATSTTGAPTTGDIWTGLHVNRSSAVAMQQAWAPSTGDMRVRFKTASAYGNWLKQWHAGNAKGTVSQTSDVPTGALFEEGGNAGSSTGAYVRYADGTQIVFYQKRPMLYQSTSRMSGSVTFPVNFISTAYAASMTLVPPADDGASISLTSECVVSGIGIAELGTTYIGNKLTSGLTFNAARTSGLTNFGDGDVLYADLTITGRWYA